MNNCDISLAFCGMNNYDMERKCHYENFFAFIVGNLNVRHIYDVSMQLLFQFSPQAGLISGELGELMLFF